MSRQFLIVIVGMARSISIEWQTLSFTPDDITITRLYDPYLAFALDFDNNFVGEQENIGKTQVTVQQPIAVAFANNQDIGAHDDCSGMNMTFFHKRHATQRP
ncbi:MAG TPA: hypothetical protein VJ654_08200 [Noviherbaspirillum sp.]|nr:hypothetical protein [Noviherbaspirillum sp.]